MIETENLTRKFGELIAVENLTLKVEEGEVFGFLGPNAAGKTTTIRMLCCLIAKTSGYARVGDYDVGDPEDFLKIRKMIGLLPENVGLYDNLSAYKNLDFYGKLYEVSSDRREENIKRLLGLLGLWERRDHLVGTFSKGTKQKLAIARALIHDPQLLFLDEPTANLDPEASRTVRDFIFKLKEEKRTIFINTHNLGEAERLCDRIGILRKRLLTIGSTGSLINGLQSRKTVIHLRHVDPKLLAAVDKLNSVKDVQIVSNKLVLDMDDPERDNPEVVRRIVETGGKVQYVTELKSTLEDVYLKNIRRADDQ